MARNISKKTVEKPIQIDDRLVGYARVSTMEQNLDAQVSALKAYGVNPDYIFIEKVSAVSSKRPQYSLMRKMLQRGDTLVVYSLSRLGRDVGHLLKVNGELLEEGVALKSLTEPIDTRTADGKLMFTMRAAFAQFERDVTIERTRHGLRNRQAEGHILGRKREMTAAKLKLIKADLKKPTETVKTVAKKHKVSVATIYAYLKGGKSSVLR